VTFSSLSQLHPPLDAGLAAIGAAEMRQLHHEFPGGEMREVVEMFQGEAELRLKQIASAVEQHDGEALRRAAHALQGAGTNFGARPLEALCLKIEVLVRGNDLSGAIALLDQIRAECGRVELALQKECGPS
jgi:histidine phosphotransfer protein HptB